MLRRTRIPRAIAAITFPHRSRVSSLAQSRRATVEVERKFNITADVRLHLSDTVGWGPQRLLPDGSPPTVQMSVERYADEGIQDQYLDFNNQLVSEGIWLRRRKIFATRDHGMNKVTAASAGFQWEAKRRLGGDYVDSQFEEIVGEEDIKILLQSIDPSLTIEKLQPFADLITYREAYAVQENLHTDSSTYNVVIDRCCAGQALSARDGSFRHSVGEVELAAVIDLPGSKISDAMAKADAALKMKKALDGFMARNADLFPTDPVPMGKLSAYFAHKNKGEEEK